MSDDYKCAEIIDDSSETECVDTITKKAKTVKRKVVQPILKLCYNEDPSIYQDKQIYNLVLETKVESDYYDKMYRLLTIESNLENAS